MTTTSSGSTRILEGARDLAIYRSPFIDIDNHQVNIANNGTNERPGLQALLRHAMPDAFYDSASRWPPPRCHYDSRLELRSTVTDWGIGCSNDIPESLLWMCGPFGVGKSAIAQSCAEALAAENKLCASMFFSRPNRRNDPNRVFTSIAYQLALKCPSVCDILDHKILRNPTLLTASQLIQFEELLVEPLRQITLQDLPIEGWVVVLDGLDEVDGIAAQLEIIRIVATSIRARTTPFRWFILSRPELHIQRAMSADNISPLLHYLDLPLSPEDDHEIRTFFEKELEEIGKQYNLPPSWCSEASIAVLVRLANGLWVYVNTVTRFIGDSNSLGPIAQLHRILALGEEPNRDLSRNPLAAMDLFYALIMSQVPLQVISTIRKILLLNKLPHLWRPDKIFEIADILDLSERQFYVACEFFRSVLVLQNSPEIAIKFYHPSFKEFLEDEWRSGEHCIFGECLGELITQIVDRLEHLKTEFEKPSGEQYDTDIPSSFCSSLASLLGLCEISKKPLGDDIAASLLRVPFYVAPAMLNASGVQGIYLHPSWIRANLSTELSNKILRRSRNPLDRWRRPEYASSDGAFILGYGKNKLVCWRDKKNPEFVVLR